MGNANLPSGHRDEAVENNSHKTLIGGAKDKWRDCFETRDSSLWAFEGVDAGVHNDVAGDTQGSGHLCLSPNPLTTAIRSMLVGKLSVLPPYRVGYGATLSPRLVGDMSVIGCYAVDANGAIERVPGETTDGLGPALTVDQFTVASNIAYLRTTTDHNLRFDDYVVLSGTIDNRLSLIGRVSAIRNKRVIAVPFTFANGTYAAQLGAGARIQKLDPSFGAANAYGVMYTEASSSNAIYWNRAYGGPIMWSAQTSFGTSHSDPLVPSAQPYACNLLPRAMTEFVHQVDMLRWMIGSLDAASAYSASFKRTQVVPKPDATYVMGIACGNLPNKPRYLTIASAVKNGTTTATVTTEETLDVPNGSTIYVRLYGQNDTTAWANVTSDTAATVTGPNTCTVVWGTAVTATRNGGVMVVAPAAAATSINAARVLGTCWYGGRLYAALSADPALTVGDIVRLAGCYESNTNAKRDLSGRYRVLASGAGINLQDAGIFGGGTTTGNGTITMPVTGAVPVGAVLTGTGLGASAVVTAVTPGVSVTVSVVSTATGSGLYDIATTGVVLEPVDAAAPADLQPVNPLQAGCIIKESTLRMHFARVLDYTRTPVDITGSHGHMDAQAALPGHIVNTVAATATTTEGTLVTPSDYTLNSAATTNAANIKSTAATLYGGFVKNTSAAAVTVKLYNKATAPTVGTDVPWRSYTVAAGGELSSIDFGRAGARLSAGLSIAITANPADTDSTVVTTGVKVGLSYI